MFSGDEGVPPMPKQPAIPGLRDAMKKKVTRREQFLAEMEAVVPWSHLIALIVPHYPKAGPKGGRCRWRQCCGCTWFALNNSQRIDFL
jgi:hypothetical protein